MLSNIANAQRIEIFYALSIIHSLKLGLFRILRSVTKMKESIGTKPPAGIHSSVAKKNRLNLKCHN